MIRKSKKSCESKEEFRTTEIAKGNLDVSRIIGEPSFKRIVLTEEDYVRRLSKIIRQGYFPDAPDLLVEEDAEAMEKARKGIGPDYVLIRTTNKKIDSVSDEALTIHEFQKYYTSEDNASFEDLQRRAQKLNEKRRELFGLDPSDVGKKPLFSMLQGKSYHDKVAHKLLKNDLNTKGSYIKVASAQTRFSQKGLNSFDLDDSHSVSTETTSAAELRNNDNYEFIVQPHTGSKNLRFAIAEPSPRENLSYIISSRASSKITENERKKKRSKRASAFDASNPTLSRAAKRLAKRILN